MSLCKKLLDLVELAQSFYLAKYVYQLLVSSFVGAIFDTQLLYDYGTRIPNPDSCLPELLLRWFQSNCEALPCQPIFPKHELSFSADLGR